MKILSSKNTMKSICFLSLIFLIWACGSDPAPKGTTTPENTETSFALTASTKIVIATKAKGQELISISDDWTKKLGLFNLQNVFKTKSTDKKEADYLEFAKTHVLTWTDEEIATIEKLVTSSAKKIKDLGLKLSLPAKIYILKTTQQEAGGASGYTRGEWIALKAATIKEDIAEFIFLHEVFHVYSRKNKAKRDAIYATIGFKPCNKIEVPAEIKPLYMLNPDAPHLEHYIELNIDGKAQEAVFITYSARPWNGGGFFDKLQKRLMIVEGADNAKKPKIVGNFGVYKGYAEASDLRKKIGTNTGYDLHPEEVLADHFATLVTRKNSSNQVPPEPKFIDAIKAILK